MAKTQKIRQKFKYSVSLNNTLEKNLKAVDEEIIYRLDKSIPMINDIGQHLIKASGKRVTTFINFGFCGAIK